MMKRFFLPLLALGALVSCTKDEAPDIPVDGRIRITAAIAGASAPAVPAASGASPTASGREFAPQTPQTLQTGQTPQTRGIVLGSQAQTGLVLLRVDAASGTAPASFAGAAYITADRAADGTLSNFSAQQNYALDNSNAWFAGFHPAGTKGSDRTSWTIPAGGTQDILLTTEAWSAGRYTSPVTTGMVFDHALACLKVNCTADALRPQGDVQATWGKITKIELLETAATATYTYADRKMAFTGSTALALSQADCQTAFAPVTLDATNQLCAGGMFAPAASGTEPLKLKIYTEKKTSGVEVAVQLRDGAADKGFEAGMTHTVSLVFDALSVRVASTVSISDWSDGTRAYPYVMEGKYIVSWDMAGYSGAPLHPNWTASTMPAHDDASEDNALAVEFEVAAENCNSTNAPGVAQYNGYLWGNALSACAAYSQVGTTAGQWRLPTFKELQLIYAKKNELTVSGFPDYFYWSATQNSGNSDDYAWAVNFNSGGTSSEYMSFYNSVRCVRDIGRSDASSYPYVLEGKYLVSRDASGSSGVPFHANWTAATMPRHTNTSPDNTVSRRFELAYANCNTSNAPGSTPWEGSTDHYDWAEALDACARYSQASGAVGTWRLPTFAEFAAIRPIANSHGTNLFTGVQDLLWSDYGWYWVSTESNNAANSFLGNTYYGMEERGKTARAKNQYVRCVRDDVPNPAVTYPYVLDGAIIVSKDGYGGSVGPFHDNWTAATMPAHNETSGDNALAAKFEVASEDCNSTNDTYMWVDALSACAAYTQTGTTHEQTAGNWRLPTQKELQLICSKESELTGVGSFVARSGYWSATGYSSGSGNAWAVSSSDGYPISYNKNNYFYVRCVRDI